MRPTHWPLLLVLALAAPAAAVTTSHWTAATEADFKAGKTHDVVTTSLGHLRLGRAVRTLLAEQPKVAAVYALAEAADGTVYAGTGPQGVLLRVRADKVETVAELGDGVNITALLVDPDGGLLVGVGGGKGLVYRIEHPDQPKAAPIPIFQADGVQYVWAMVPGPGGAVDLATGPTGTLFELKADGSHDVLLKTDENNLTCLATDGKDLLYAGSDTTGLVYRVNRRTRQSFVLYNAAETEIGALAVGPRGDLYVGTAQASDPSPPSTDDAAAKDKVGHPDGGPGGAPLPSGPPAAPAPPPAPPPNPGQPDPIPKNLMILPDGPGDGPGDPPGTRARQAARPGPAKPPGSPSPASPPASGPTQQATNPATTGQPAPNGNAVYRIDPDGFVTEVFRGPVLVLAMAAAADGSVLVATGSDGGVYQIDPAADETAVVAHLDVKQVTALLPDAGRPGRARPEQHRRPGRDGGRVRGPRHLHQPGPGRGADQPVRQGATARHAPGRHDADPVHPQRQHEGADRRRLGPLVARARRRRVRPAAAPPARFFQYRLTFATTGATATPTVDDADVAYLMPNLPPVIKSVKVATAGKPAAGNNAADAPQPQQQADASAAVAPPSHVQTVSWEASDPNNDPLTFAVYERPGRAGPWVLLKDKLKDPTYDWDTRGVADGRYEVRVTASDAAANPVGQGKVVGRVSDPVLVDNTPPVLGDVKVTVTGTSATVAVRAVDAGSTVAAVDYAVDSAGDWQAATPSDTMFDSPEARATLTAAGLTPGPHTIAVRATDARGNQAFQNVTVAIEPPATAK